MNTPTAPRRHYTNPPSDVVLLKAFAYGWRKGNLAENAQKINYLARELYKRIQVVGGHFNSVGKNLQSAVNAYNNTANSLETRLLVTARKFQELDVATTEKEIDPAHIVEAIPRVTSAENSGDESTPVI